MTQETPVTRSKDIQPIPEYFVGRETVNRRVKKFMAGKRQLLTNDMNANGLSSEESKHVWYPKEYIEVLVDELQHYGGNGVRIYFGEYENDIMEAAPGQLGLLLVLTREEDDGKIHDILFEEQEDYSLRIGNFKSKGIDLSQSYVNGKPREFNAMLPCPPLCPKNHVAAFPEEELS